MIALYVARACFNQILELTSICTKIMNSFSGAELEKQRFNASKHLQEEHCFKKKFKAVKFQGVSRPSCPSLPTPITAPISLQW